MTSRNLYVLILVCVYLTGCFSEQPPKTVPVDSDNKGESKVAQESATNKNDSITEAPSAKPQSDQKTTEALSARPQSDQEITEVPSAKSQSDQETTEAPSARPQSDQEITTGDPSNQQPTGSDDSIPQTGGESQEGMSAFHFAVITNDIEGVREYVRTGGEINAESLIAEITSPEMLQVFIENNADLNAYNVSGQTALIRLVRNRRIGYVKMVRMLLENRADPDKPDIFKMTALHYTNQTHLDTFPYPSIRLTDLRESLDRIHASEHPEDLITEVARNLVSSQNDIEEVSGLPGIIEPQSIPHRGKVRIVEHYITSLILTEMLLKHEADVSQTKDEYSPTALMRASINGFVPAVEMLLEHDADPNAKTYELSGISELAIRDAMRRAGLSQDQFNDPVVLSPMLCASVGPVIWIDYDPEIITEILIGAGAEPLANEPEQEEKQNIANKCSRL